MVDVGDEVEVNYYNIHPSFISNQVSQKLRARKIHFLKEKRKIFAFPFQTIYIPFSFFCFLLSFLYFHLSFYLFLLLLFVFLFLPFILLHFQHFLSNFPQNFLQNHSSLRFKVHYTHIYVYTRREKKTLLPTVHHSHNTYTAPLTHQPWTEHPFNRAGPGSTRIVVCLLKYWVNINKINK